MQRYHYRTAHVRSIADSLDECIQPQPQQLPPRRKIETPDQQAMQLNGSLAAADGWQPWMKLNTIKWRCGIDARLASCFTMDCGPFVT